MIIASVTARQLLDCKARPLVEVEIATDTGHVGRGAAPTGSSVGAHEAFILRDGDPDEYNGLSVHRAVRAVNEVIAPALIGRAVDDQRAIDDLLIELDGTADKSRLGGNSIYSTSIAVLRAASSIADVPTYEYLRQMMGLEPLSSVPVPSFNVINGGVYGDVTQAFNEFLVMPYRAESIQSAVEMSVRVFHLLEDELTERYGSRPRVASSYGFAAPSADPRTVLDVIRAAVDRAGYIDQFAFALDCASSEMYDADTQTYELDGARVSAEELIAFTADLSREFPLVFVEDLLDEDDWDNYPKAVSGIERTIILGDDLIVTNPKMLERAAASHAVDGFILKPNQVGTITEALDCFTFAKERGLLAIPSGRSGGVIDDVVMDMSVGLSVPFQKNGAPRSGERIEKLNFLMRAAENIPNCVLADVPGLVRF
jgi:enolase